METLPYLSLLTFLPAVAGAVLALVPGDKEAKGGALAASVVVFAISLAMWAQYVPPAAPALAFVEDHVWIRSLNIHYRMGIDGLGEIMAQQDIFRRDGAVGFQLEHPMSVGLPITEQRFGRRRDALLQRDGIDGRGVD